MSNANISSKFSVKFKKGFLFLIIPIALFLVMMDASAAQNATFIVYPVEYPNALKNPLMGFADNGDGAANPYFSTRFIFIHWNDIENNASDGVDKLVNYTNTVLAGYPQNNIKVYIRVALECSTCDSPNTYWPADMTTGDYSSAQFKSRLRGLIVKMGQAWDNDPRIGFVEMGLISNWGEQGTPPLTSELQTILGDSFTGNFTHKKVMVRYYFDFTSYNFGIYWDSFAHYDQESHVAGIRALGSGERWKTQIMGQEVAYDWGNYRIQPGASPDDSLSDPTHRTWIIDRIRDLHVTGLDWIGNYNTRNATVAAGAELMQKAFGYRYVIQSVEYNQTVAPGENLTVSFTVNNTGSAPFYYNWPVEVSLMSPDTKQAIWRNTFSGLDIRKWLPGDNWNYTTKKYDIAPISYNIQQTFTLPSSLPEGEYIIALAILDPAGNLPSVKFAIKNYYNGGRHPIGKIGIGVNITDPLINNFDNPAKDSSLHYTLDGQWNLIASPPLTYINGTVRNNSVNISGATITTNTGVTAISDANGFYSLNLVNGTYQLTTSKEPEFYINCCASVTVTPPATITKDIILNKKPTGTISGKVSAKRTGNLTGIISMEGLTSMILCLRSCENIKSYFNY